MSFKVVAMGNMLMKDDGAGIEVAKKIEEELVEKNIEVIYGETDIEYIISRISEKDYIFVLDAACYGKNPGEITSLPLNAFVSKKKSCYGHDYSFLDLMKVYCPDIRGEVYGIEVSQVEFGLGLSHELQNCIGNISKEILNKIYKKIAMERENEYA